MAMAENAPQQYKYLEGIERDEAVGPAHGLTTVVFCVYCSEYLDRGGGYHADLPSTTYQSQEHFRE